MKLKRSPQKGYAMLAVLLALMVVCLLLFFTGLWVWSLLI